MNLLVAINPHSGGGRGRTIGLRVRHYLENSNHNAVYVEASSLRETLELLRSECSRQDFHSFVCVGGDGFVHDVLPILIEYRLALLVIPAGTGNDFARTLGLYGADFKILLEYLTNSSPKLIDIALVRHGDVDAPFVQILSTGFDSVVNERANNFKRVRGKFKYVVAVLLEVWKFKSINFKISVDERQITGNAMLVCVANGVSYGAGMKVAPFAKNDDGSLEVMVVDHVSPLRLLLVFPRVFIGTHVKHPKVHFYSGSRIRIEGDTWAFADGEKIAHLPVDVSVSEYKLPVYRL